ncbi:hypothetical protein [Prevotella merdae]|uniref:hypothetical protein n=1 Tax=Prevotella merdae TaxID=2079531 RepID=UPI003564F46C
MRGKTTFTIPSTRPARGHIATSKIPYVDYEYHHIIKGLYTLLSRCIDPWNNREVWVDKYCQILPAYIYGSGLARYGIILGDFYEKDNKDSRFMPLNEPNDILLRLYLTKENWLMMCLLLLFKRRR